MLEVMKTKSPRDSIDREASMRTAPATRRTPAVKDPALRFARVCYDHLAGELGVLLREAFERKGFLVERGTRDYKLTPRGEAALVEWRIDPVELRRMRRNFARRCLDWTEQRDHIAGALGAAIYQRFLELRWITRRSSSRVVSLSPSGRRHLDSFLGLPSGRLPKKPGS